jgi:hypothetical protein
MDFAMSDAMEKCKEEYLSEVDDLNEWGFLLMR